MAIPASHSLLGNCRCDARDGRFLSAKASGALRWYTRGTRCERQRTSIVDLADGPQLLRHGQSDYVQQFGMSVDTTPLQITSRTLPPPTMLYGGSSREVSNLFGLMRCANKRLSVGQVRRLEHVRKYRRFVATCSCTSQGEQAFH